jgi:peroxiredoxin (alkyl hydroperoxide reductase subunit C)
MSVLVGRKAPEFTAPAVLLDGAIVEDFDFSRETQGKYAVLFFYPLDFTFVCPSELIAFNHRLDEFEVRDTQVIGVSVDSHYTHNAWRNTPVENGGIGPVRYPLVADLTHAICQAYDVEAPGGDVALRGSFLIDREGIVRHQIINDLPLGRDIGEMLRILDALHFMKFMAKSAPQVGVMEMPG